MNGLERSRRQAEFAARVIAKRREATQVHTCESPAQYAARIEYAATQAAIATEARTALAATRQRQLAIQREARQARIARRAEIHSALPADVVPTDVSPIYVSQLGADLRAELTDRVARATLAQDRNYVIEQAMMSYRANRLLHMNETERLLRRAEYRDERSLLAQSGFSQAHRVMVSDDTWNVSYETVERRWQAFLSDPQLALTRLKSLGSRFTLRGYGSTDISECSVLLYSADGSVKPTLVPHSAFEPEREAVTASGPTDAAIKREQARQARESAAVEREAKRMQALSRLGTQDGID